MSTPPGSALRALTRLPAPRLGSYVGQRVRECRFRNETGGWGRYGKRVLATGSDGFAGDRAGGRTSEGFARVRPSVRSGGSPALRGASQSVARAKAPTNPG